ncbi:MAG: hypothetical protein C0478_08320 [Planctomyces sp.]|nr:hypothetical protein [Planctomyces sp.]
MSTVPLQPFDLRRVEMAINKIQERLLRATAALETAHVPYAVVGGNAVANWVSRIDEAAVRFTADVDLLFRRDDIPAAIEALQVAGFIHRHAAGIDFFTDGPEGKFRDAVHIVKANEKVREEYVAPAPDVDESEAGPSYRVISLEALVRMKLTSFRDKDRTHLRDILDVGLIDATWPAQYHPELGRRLQSLIDTPEG